MTQFANPLDALQRDPQLLSRLAAAATRQGGAASARATGAMQMGTSRFAEGRRRSAELSLDAKQRQTENLQAIIARAIGQFGQRQERGRERDFRSAERVGAEEFKTRERKAEQTFRTGERKGGEVFTKGEREAGEKFEIGEAKLDRLGQRERQKIREAGLSTRARQREEFELRMQKGKGPTFSQQQSQELRDYVASGKKGAFLTALHSAYRRENPESNEGDFRDDIVTGRYPPASDATPSGRISSRDIAYTLYARNVSKAVEGAIAVGSDSGTEIIKRYFADLPSMLEQADSENAKRILRATAFQLKMLLKTEEREQFKVPLLLDSDLPNDIPQGAELIPRMRAQTQPAFVPGLSGLKTAPRTHNQPRP